MHAALLLFHTTWVPFIAVRANVKHPQDGCHTTLHIDQPTIMIEKEEEDFSDRIFFTVICLLLLDCCFRRGSPINGYSVRALHVKQLQALHSLAAKDRNNVLSQSSRALTGYDCTAHACTHLQCHILLTSPIAQERNVVN
jgi:hypothetical protein